MQSSSGQQGNRQPQWCLSNICPTGGRGMVEDQGAACRVVQDMSKAAALVFVQLIEDIRHDDGAG